MTSDFTRTLQRWGLIAGVVAAALAIIGAVNSGLQAFLSAYLFAYLFWLWLSLGGLGLALLHYLVAGQWGRPIRALLESAAKTTWLMLLLFIPIAIWMPLIFPWVANQYTAVAGELYHRQYYLNVPFFLARAAIYFIIWLFLTTRMTSMATEARNYTDPEARRRFRGLSGFGLVLFVLTVSFASIDWIMSLEPEWFSSMFGMLTVSGQALAAFAFAAVMLPAVIRLEPIASMITPTHIRDVGAYLLTMVVFWAYLVFMQFLIIWSGNIPREAFWYVERSTGGWLWLAVIVAIFQFTVPFFTLISLRAKRNPRVLAINGVVILVSNLIYLFWQVMPSFHPGAFAISWLDIVLPIAIGGLWLAVFAWFFARTALLAPEPAADHLRGASDMAQSEKPV